jgi:hypothetical protein
MGDHPFLDEKRWRSEIREWSYPGVVETFYRLYAEKMGKSIWGDKTPFYLVLIPKLKTLFPAAKFVHIVRDVRDYVVSLNKDWSKNIFRSAQRWHDAVERCRQDGIRVCPEDYLEVKYEGLSDDPEGTLKTICDFLTVSYEASMVRLKKPADDRTEAGDRLSVKKRNYGKWESTLRPGDIRRLEEICGTLLTHLGYQVSYRGTPVRIGPVRMKLYQLADAAALYRFEVREGGLIEGSKNMIRTLQYAKYRVAPGGEEN